MDRYTDPPGMFNVNLGPSYFRFNKIDLSIYLFCKDLIIIMITYLYNSMKTIYKDKYKN